MRLQKRQGNKRPRNQASIPALYSLPKSGQWLGSSTYRCCTAALQNENENRRRAAPKSCQLVSRLFFTGVLAV